MNLLRRLLLQNLWLKAISFLLAFLLWVQIAGQQRVQRTIAIPVEFINMPAELEITNDYPKEVNVLISKPSSAKMDERELAAVIDLRGAEPGVATLPLTETAIRNLPTGVSIEGIEHRRLRLQLERTRRKIVKIEPEIVGQPADGYELVDYELVPSEVLISGPESRLERVTTAQTEPIDIGGRKSGLTRNVYLDLEDPRLRIEQVSSVDVAIRIEEERRDIDHSVPLRFRSGAQRAKVGQRSLNVVFSVPISYTGEIDFKDFQALLTLPEEAGRGQVIELTPDVLIPEEYSGLVRVESWEPQFIKVTLVR